MTSRRVFRLPALIVSVLCTVLSGSLAGTSAAAEAPAPSSGAASESVTAAPDEASASIAAKESSQRVEALDRRTETAEVYANPSGTFTMELHSQPVRVRRGGSWMDLDTTLRAENGRVAPAATVAGVEFSGGGDGPLMVLSHDDKRLSLGWTAPLPVPQLAGNIATYQEVLPGIDLQAMAEPAGARLLVVVKSRDAAANPLLRRIRYRLATEGLTVRTDATSGAMTVVDSSGQAVFASGTALMWDSADKAPTVTESGGERSRNQAAAQVEVTDTELALVPDARLFTDPGTVYPVVVDPSFSTQRWVAWTHNDSGFPTVNYLNDPNRPDIPVGAYVHTNGNTHVSASYYGFADINTFRGKEVIRATFRALQIHNAPFGCTDTPVQLLWTGWFDGGTTWNNPPPVYRVLSTVNSKWKADNPSCPANWVEFNDETTRAAVQDAANAGHTGISFAMQSPDAGKTFYRKRFDKQAALVIEYNTPPDPPSGLYADINLPCVVGSGLPVTNTNPTLWATGFDADGGNVEVQFELYNNDGPLIASYRQPFLASGSRFSAVVAASAVTHGREYSWRARAGDGRVWGDWSAWCDFSVDTTKPAAMPAVSSTSFPESRLGAPVGTRGEFTFSSTDPDVYGYRYGLVQSTTYFVAAGSDPDRRATVPVTMWTTSPQFMYVYSVDRAGNRSESPHAYQFAASPSTATPPGVRSDAHGDGLADVVALHSRDADEAALLTFASKGSGQWYQPLRTWDSGVNPLFVQKLTQSNSGDFNGDGRSDLAVLRDEGNTGGTIWVFPGNGVGHNAPEGPAWDSGAGKFTVATGRTVAGDINGDGRADLINFHNWAGKRTAIWVWYGTPTGVAAPVLAWDSGVGNWDWTQCREVAGDFNGDGRADIADWCNYPNRQTKIWLFRGTANGLAAPVLGWDSGVGNWDWSTCREVAGDFTGDGKADMGDWCNYGNGRTILWLFRATATAVAAPTLGWDSGVGSTSWSELKPVTGDFSGDGRSDMGYFYRYPNNRTKFWTMDATATGVATPVMRWDSGDWGLDWTRTSFH